MDKPNFTLDRLRDMLHYDYETGVFTWRQSLGGVRAGAQAGMIERGYRRIRIDRKFHFAHRLAWLYVHGVWPSKLTDHINGIRDDNRIENLRECDAAQNAQNTRAVSSSRGRLRGAYWNKDLSKWRAQIMIQRKSICLGLYLTAEDAHAAYVKAKASLHTFQPVLRNA